jgi:hypothetical protein
MHVGVASLFWEVEEGLAMDVYRRGVDIGIWLSEEHTPPVLNRQLRSRAVPATGMFPAVERYMRVLSANWKAILKEYHATIDLHGDHHENLHKGGQWSVLEIGAPTLGNCEIRTPFLCAMIASIERQNLEQHVWVQTLRFSKLGAGAHISSHTSLNNQRLKIHLGLITPTPAAITIAGEHLEWEAGKCIMFDDSFRHHVWNNATQDRVILELKVRHPDLASSVELDEESGAVLKAPERGDHPEKMRAAQAWVTSTVPVTAPAGTADFQLPELRGRDEL